MKAIDLFCGAGGLSEGFRLADFDIALGLDMAAHACATHEKNFPEGQTWCRDITEVTSDELRGAVEGDLDVLIGGPNCQGVSARGPRDPDDPRNLMFWEYVRAVEATQPKVFVMENVAGLTHRKNWPLLQEFVARLNALGYRCAGDVVRAADFGVPQLRYRFILVGVKDYQGSITFPKPSHTDVGSLKARSDNRLKPHVTLSEAISDLPRILSGGGAEVMPQTFEAESDYQRWARGNQTVVYNHRTSNTANINLERIAEIPEGGNWKDIPQNLLPPRFFKCRMTDHSTTYARLRWGHPSFTLTALFGNVTAGAFTHPEQNRALSVREGARLHGYPDRFRFMGPLNSQYRQIGNSVPPLLAKAFGDHIRDFLVSGTFENTGDNPRLNDTFIRNTGWDNVPVLAPRYKGLFGEGTRWPKGWGPEPKDWSSALTDNYRLREPCLES